MVDQVTHISIDPTSKYGPRHAQVIDDLINAMHALEELWGVADAIRNDADPADDTKLVTPFGLPAGEGDEYYTLMNSLKTGICTATHYGWARRLRQG